MGKTGNAKKNEQLGMAYGTACGRLRKLIMFHLMQKCGMDTCYQCGEKIKSVDKLSIEHKIAWLDSEDPVDSFFDLANIAFSHLSCNCSAPKSTKLIPCPSNAAYGRGCRCDGCMEARKLYKNSLPIIKNNCALAQLDRVSGS